MKRFWIKSNEIDKVNNLILQIELIRSKSAIIVIAPDTTGYNWMGVNRATLALFPANTIVLPQFYSTTIFNTKETEIIQNRIQDLSFDQIIFSGFPNYFALWMTKLKNRDNQIGLIYHGFFSELAENKVQMSQLNEIFRLKNQGIIDKIAFNKKGMAESLGQLWKFKTHKILLTTPVLEPQMLIENGLHIGVLGNDQFRKNLHNQIVAASLIHDSHVHITNKTNLDYLHNASIFRHPTDQNHHDFTKLLGSMHINLHISYSESWGQLTTESLAMGIPCITSYHSDVFDYSLELMKKLVVEEFDNSWAIKEKIEEVLSDRAEISKLCISYIEELNLLSEKTINSFLLS